MQRKKTSPKDVYFYEFRGTNFTESDRDIDAIFNYKITPESASRLAERFNTTAQFWLNLQRMHDES